MKNRYTLPLIATGVLLFLFNLGGRDLWEPDETRYAVIARDMKENGNWILPRLNGEVYAEKPPLFFWLVNLSTFLIGKNSPFTNRLPSALAGLACIFVTFLLGERLYNARVGFLSALALTTCGLFPQISRWMMLDSLFTLCFLLSLFYCYVGFENEEKRGKSYLMAGLFLGFGVLTKGPGIYILLPLFLIYAFSQKGVRRFWCKDLLIGILLSVAIVLVWWIPACLLGGKEYIHWILYKQAVATYVEGGKHFHPEPFYFYLIRFPAEFIPWVFFLPTAFAVGLKKENRGKEFLFLTVWLIFVFLFFTLSKGKKDNYLLPLYPAAAIMVGWVWDVKILRGEKGRGIPLALLFLTVLCLIGLIAFISGIPAKISGKYTSDVQTYVPMGIFILAYLLTGSSLSLLLFLKKRGFASALILVIFFAFLHLHLAHILPEKLDKRRSMRSFSERVLRRMEPGDDLKTFYSKYNGLLYYTGRSFIEEIPTKEEFFKTLDLAQRVFIVVQARDFNQFKEESKFELKPLEQARVGRWDLILISNR